jgi:lipopolysaccharide transport system permease protein
MKQSVRYLLDLIIVLTQKELKVRYKNNVLGYLWSVANPLAFAFVFYIAFKTIMKIQMENFALFLIAGLFPWQWFANSISSTPTIFLSNASIIKKVNFPKNIIPLTIVLQDMIHFILSIPVIMLFMGIYHKPIGLIWFIGIPILLIIQFMITYGIALAVSSINLFFRDLERLITILVTLILYFTPIFYPETMLPVKFAPYLKLNPLAPLIVSWRNLFLKNELDVTYLMISFGYGLLFLLLGYLIYRKLYWKFAEVL